MAAVVAVSEESEVTRFHHGSCHQPDWREQGEFLLPFSLMDARKFAS